MTKTKPSLAAQIERSQKKKHRDVDPENEDTGYSNENAYNHGSDSDDNDDNERRQHYIIPNGQSSKRDDDSLNMLNKRYRGVKSSSDVKFVPPPDMDFDEDEEEEDSDQSLVNDDIDVDSESGEEVDDEDDEERYEGEEDDEEEVEEVESEEEKQENESDDEQDKIIAQLQSSVQADIEKGRAAKKQLIFWDTLIEARIYMQRILDNANKLPMDEPSSTEAIDNLRKLCDNLTNFRMEQMKKSPDHVKIDDDTTKSIVNDNQDDNSRASNSKALTDAYHPVAATTISKWSNKVFAASLTQMKASKGFKSSSSLASQNVWTQIETSFNSDKERLIQKAMTKKRKISDDKDSIEENGNGEELKQPKTFHIFEDSDFYTSLLKDVADSRLLSLDNQDPEAGYRQKPKKPKKVVDTKASKGRKLRYDVHEKLQNFMVPIPAGTWHDAQITELFNSLWNKNTTNNQQTSQDLYVQEKPTGLDGLKIFG